MSAFCEDCGEQDPPPWHRCPKDHRAAVTPWWRVSGVLYGSLIALGGVFALAALFLMRHP